MHRRSFHLLTVSIVLIAACKAPSASHRGDTPARSPAASSVAPSTFLDASVNMTPDFLVHTNEPFWTVTVQGNLVVLIGLEGKREMDLLSNEVLFDGRNVIAADAHGRMEVRVTPRACQDSMSGERFPYTARVTVDTATPVLGCARDP